MLLRVVVLLLAAGNILRAGDGAAALVGDLTFFHDRFYAVGESGFIQTSPDGLVWTLISSPTPHDLYGTTVIDDQLFVWGDERALFSTEDGSTWEDHSPPLPPVRLSWTRNDLVGLGHIYGKYVVAFSEGAIITSPDLQTWTTGLEAKRDSSSSYHFDSWTSSSDIAEMWTERDWVFTLRVITSTHSGFEPGGSSSKSISIDYNLQLMNPPEDWNSDDHEPNIDFRYKNRGYGIVTTVTSDESGIIFAGPFDNPYRDWELSYWPVEGVESNLGGTQIPESPRHLTSFGRAGSRFFATAQPPIQSDPSTHPARVELYGSDDGFDWQKITDSEATPGLDSYDRWTYGNGVYLAIKRQLRPLIARDLGDWRMARSHDGETWEILSPDTVELPDETPLDYQYGISDGNVTISYYIGTGGSVTVPATIEGLPVTTIGHRAFQSKTGLNNVTIPDSVTTIGEHAFSENTFLFNVVLGDGVTSIGESAFSDNPSLTSVVLGDAVTRIPDHAFSDCTRLTRVTIPDSVNSIGEGAFGFSGLTSIVIPDSATSIGTGTFRGCPNLTSVTIGNSVTSIGLGAFRSCDSLTNFSVKTANTSYSSADGVLFDKDQATLIQYPGGKAGAYSIPDSVTSIRDSAFRSCAGLTNVTIPDSVRRIPEYAFEDSHLTNVTFGNGVASIGNRAFRECWYLTSVIIPDNVRSIGEFAFDNCFNLTSITIPDSVTSMGNNAFSECDRLTSVTIGNGLTRIERRAFFDSGLTSVTIPDNVTSIGDEAFSRCGSLTDVTIGNSVTSIGDEAFSRCGSLTDITIGDSVTNIGDEAFSDCGSLTDVTIPDSVTSIGWGAFRYCDSLTILFFKGNAPHLTERTFEGANNADVFYLAGTTGWSATFGGRPTRLTTGERDALIGGINLDLVDTWFGSGWFGSYSTMFAPWLYHIDHGFIYRYPPSSNAGMYIWDIKMRAWWWTNANSYPYIYALDPVADNAGTDIGAEWLFYGKDTRNPRSFRVVTGDFAWTYLYYGP